MHKSFIVTIIIVSVSIVVGCSSPQSPQVKNGDSVDKVDEVNTIALDECEKLNSIEDKDSCYAEKGEQTGNLDYCKLVKDKQEREKWCYYEIGYEYNNVSACEKITTVNWRDACFIVVCMQTQNKDLCEKITDVEQKNACIEMANQDFQY